MDCFAVVVDASFAVVDGDDVAVAVAAAACDYVHCEVDLDAYLHLAVKLDY